MQSEGALFCKHLFMGHKERGINPGLVAEHFMVTLPYREKVGEDVKVSELQGTDNQEIHITLMPENEAEKALVQILDQAQAQFSVDNSAEAGLIIIAKIRSRSSVEAAYSARRSVTLEE